MRPLFLLVIRTRPGPRRAGRLQPHDDLSGGDIPGDHQQHEPTDTPHAGHHGEQGPAGPLSFLLFVLLYSIAQSISIRCVTINQLVLSLCYE